MSSSHAYFQLNRFLRPAFRPHKFSYSSGAGHPPHIPVMVDEVIDFLAPKSGQVFLDMTFGCGGHSSALLHKSPETVVFCLDRDPSTLPYMDQLKSVCSSFS
ncbi:unnamed protein product [Protopolystoma xenopodis]|uniref:Uncharacterized protein n=1 Tax=Protopolystoma xenopodis TaxID=117903 RepID=A0A3S5AGY6_9PLAT|nr:unnamed protein product [Protopolystoma xenopodis]